MSEKHAVFHWVFEEALAAAEESAPSKRTTAREGKGFGGVHGLRRRENYLLGREERSPEGSGRARGARGTFPGRIWPGERRAGNVPPDDLACPGGGRACSPRGSGLARTQRGA